VASAQQNPTCSELPGEKVYVQSGDTQEPLLKELGRKLRDSASKPLTLVYVTAGSCTNIDAFYNGTPITVAARYVPSTAENPGWTPAMPALVCDMPAGGVPIDIAISALFVSACDPSPPPAGVRLVQGPVQAYVMVVPEASRETAITAEEAYFVFGFGAAGMALPWVNEALMFIRTITKSTLLTWAAAIEVPADRWKGVRIDRSTEVLNGVSQASDPQAAIGLLGAEIYDKNRDVLNVLAYRAYGQKYAYYPDSTATSFDKRNLRDGHYTVWSPTVYLLRENAGAPVNPNARYVVDLVLGVTTTPAADFDSLQVVVKQGLVPDCAMQVTRSEEGGDLSLYAPAEPCGCYFDSVVATAACTACSEQNLCASGVCRRGYCEAR
jgi:hypothetical protein